MRHLQVLLTILFIFIVGSAVAQLHLFGGVGASNYQGDVYSSPSFSNKTILFSWKLGVGYDFHPRWGVRAHYSSAGAHGSDAYSSDAAVSGRGVSFESEIIDAGVTIKFKHLFKRSYQFINYAFLGFDYTDMDVERIDQRSADVVPEDDFSDAQLNMPIGIGLGWWFNRHWGVVMETSYHHVFSDYLDGISVGGNPETNDSYVDLHVMLLYRFGGGNTGRDGVFDPSRLNNVDCPKWGY